MDGDAVCRACRGPREPASGDGGVCESCELDIYPSIQNRGGRWSPLQLGLMSLICDIFMIPTVLAISRGFSELREVGRRERAGYWDDEHPAVRTSAVWGALLGAARPLLVVLLILVVTVGAALEENPSEVEVSNTDELGEVLERLESPNEHTRQTAIRHLGAVPINAAGAQRLYDALDAPTALDGAEAREMRGAVVRAAIGAFDSEVDPDARLEQLAAHADSVDAEALRALVNVAADRACARSYAVLVELMRRPEPPPLPLGRLIDHRSMAHLYLAPLLELDLDSPARRDAVHLAARVCGSVDAHTQGLLRADPSIERSLMVDWARARASLLELPEPEGLAGRLDPARTDAVDYATDALFGLRCARSDATDAVLESASRSSSVRVAGAATAVRHEGVLPRRALRTLLADPFTRRWGLDTVMRGVEPNAPRRIWGTQARAHADLIAWLLTHQLTPDAIEHEALQRRSVPGGFTRERETMLDLHIFAVHTGERVERFAVGPYNAGRRDLTATGYVIPAGPALDADWGGVAAAQLVDQVMTRWEGAP